MVAHSECVVRHGRLVSRRHRGGGSIVTESPSRLRVISPESRRESPPRTIRARVKRRSRRARGDVRRRWRLLTRRIVDVAETGRVAGFDWTLEQRRRKEAPTTRSLQVGGGCLSCSLSHLLRRAVYGIDVI